MLNKVRKVRNLLERRHQLFSDDYVESEEEERKQRQDSKVFKIRLSRLDAILDELDEGKIRPSL